MIKKATFDTNIANHDALVALACANGFSIFFVTVTDRELEVSDILPSSSNRIIETAVFGESRFGNSLFASEDDDDILEKVLSIISSNAFPPLGMRTQLSDGQKRQLCDAMIFVAHVREHGQVFVTKDERAFVREGRRERLEEIGSTKILTPIEFEEYLKYSKTPNHACS